MKKFNWLKPVYNSFQIENEKINVFLIYEMEKEQPETLVISIRSLWLLLTPGSIYRTWIIFSCMGFRTTYCKECIFSQFTLVCLDKEGRDDFQLLYRTVFGRQHREYTGERHSTLTGSTDKCPHLAQRLACCSHNSFLLEKIRTWTSQYGGCYPHMAI